MSRSVGSSVAATARPSLHWVALGGLLVLLVAAAATFDPRRWPQPVGDEATYLMAAQSLAWDFDFRYTLGDLQRFRDLREVEPDGLILQSSDGGETLVYGKPLLYPLFLAAWSRLLPLQGPAVANALLLALAAWMAARSLGTHLGRSSPLWVATFLFASVVFVHTFWAHADLFLMSLMAIALSLVMAGEAAGKAAGEAAGKPAGQAAGGSAGGCWREVLAAVLVGLVILTRPFYLPLAVPLLLRARSRRRLLPAAVALVAAVLGGILLNAWIQGTWTTYAGERQAYYGYTGFAGEEGVVPWSERVAARGDNAWVGSKLLPFGFDLRLTAWNGVYLFFGRNVGLLPYFLPLVLGLIAMRADSVRWSLLLAFLAVAGLFLLARPFNFWGGGGALANRYLLPAFPALWFLAGRRSAAFWPLLVALCAAPTMWPSWSEPRGFLRDDDAGYRHVSRWAERWLPYETTQNHLKPSGRDDFLHRSPTASPPLWVKPLSPRVVPWSEGELMLLRDGERSAQILIGADRPLLGLRIEEMVMEQVAKAAAPEPSSAVLTDDAEATLQPVPGRVLEILPVPRRARHRMWWTTDLVYIYQLDLERLLASWNVGPEVLVRIVAIPQER